MWGARSNRESANSALCAAVTGYVPEYGLLLDENRKGDIVVHVEANMKSDYEYHLLGMMGEKIGEGIPVFTGLPKHISSEALRNLGAQLNTSGAYGMYHIVGFTPEAPTLEAALGGKAPKHEVVITDKDLKDFEEKFSDASHDGKVDFAMFGCPHFTLKEAMYIAKRIEGKKLAIPMYILTSSDWAEMAHRMGVDVYKRQGQGRLAGGTDGGAGIVQNFLAEGTFGRKQQVQKGRSRIHSGSSEGMGPCSCSKARMQDKIR